MGRWKLATGVVAVVVGAGIGGVLVGGASDDGADADTDDDSVTAPNTAEVTDRDLTRYEELDGTIDFGTAKPLVLATTGTITAAPKVDDVIETGDTVLEVDGRPVIAVEGSFPFWRPLNNDMDDGKDVMQLEAILAEMGYAEEYDVTVDDEFTWNTQEALEAFQEDHGLDDDGELAVGEVVVISGSLRVDSVGGALGQPASAAQIAVTAPGRTVQTKVPVSDADLATKGTVLDVELPNGDVVKGEVVRIGDAETDADGNNVLPVSIAVDGVGDLADGTAVQVRLVVEEAKDAKAVPVEAILALAEGGYAVEVPGQSSGGGDGADAGADAEADTADTTGTTDASSELVAVELGMFTDGWVEITGDIEPGTEVVIP